MFKVLRSATCRLQTGRSASADRAASNGSTTAGLCSRGFTCGDSTSSCPLGADGICASAECLEPPMATVVQVGSTSNENFAPRTDSRPSMKRTGATRWLGLAACSSGRDIRCMHTCSASEEPILFDDEACENVAPPSIVVKQQQEPLRTQQGLQERPLGDVTNTNVRQLPPQLPAQLPPQPVRETEKLLAQSTAHQLTPSVPFAPHSGTKDGTSMDIHSVEQENQVPRSSATNPPPLPWPFVPEQPLPQPPPPSAGSYCHAVSVPAPVESSLMPPPKPAGTKVATPKAATPQAVVEYVGDILRAMQHSEADALPHPNYMDNQPNLSTKMRAILVDWLVDVHRKYKLRPETLFLAVGLMDRYLEKRLTPRRYLQLVGATAMLVAAKYEETYPPKVKDFVFVTDKAYTEDEVLRMEISMLTALEFRVCRPTAVHFMERYVQLNGCSDSHRHLVHYLLELTLVEYKMVRWCPSHLAAAALLLSNKLLRRQPTWTPALVKHTGVVEKRLNECAMEVCMVLEGAEQNHLQAVRKKFSLQKYSQISKTNFVALLSRAPPAPLVADSVEGRKRNVALKRSPPQRAPSAQATSMHSLSSGSDATADRCFAHRAAMLVGPPLQHSGDTGLPAPAPKSEDMVCRD